MSIRVSLFTMWVDERCTIVTSAPCSQSAPQMSKAELLLPTTTTFLPAYASGPGCCEEWCCSPRKTSWPGNVGTLALPDIPVASTTWVGCRVIGSPSRSTSTVQVPAASSYDAPLATVSVQYGT